jgi:hypothetical protein
LLTALVLSLAGSSCRIHCYSARDTWAIADLLDCVQKNAVNIDGGKRYSAREEAGFNGLYKTRPRLILYGVLDRGEQDSLLATVRSYQNATLFSSVTVEFFEEEPQVSEVAYPSGDIISTPLPAKLLRREVVRLK